MCKCIIKILITPTQLNRLILSSDLCSGPKGPANITLSFIWNHFHTRMQHFTRRPWARCTANVHLLPCNSTTPGGIPNCDGSDVEGKDSRWACGTSLDEVQSKLKSKRKFNVVTQGGIWDALHIFRGQQLDIDDSGDFGWATDAAPRLYETLKREHNESESSKCWTVNGEYGGKELLMSPLSVRGIKCDHCGIDVTKVAGVDCKKNNTGLSKVLDIFRESQLKSGIIGTIFDRWVDANAITSAAYGAPFSIQDGIHYPNVVYRALVHSVMNNIISANSPS